MSTSVQYSSAYVRADGDVISSAWKGRDIPVPPPWVKQFTSLPQNTEAACVARELAGIFPAEARKVMVRYITEWPLVQKYGHHMLVMGLPSTWKRRQWAAAATVNEVIMRYAPHSDVSQQFLSVPLLRGVLPFKTTRFDSYAAFRSKILSAKLLVIEEPLNIPTEGEERWFISDVYQIRMEKRLPTITTLGVASDEPFKKVQRMLGQYVADILHDKANYHVHI